MWTSTVTWWQIKKKNRWLHFTENATKTADVIAFLLLPLLLLLLVLLLVRHDASSPLRTRVSASTEEREANGPPPSSDAKKIIFLLFFLWNFSPPLRQFFLVGVRGRPDDLQREREREIFVSVLGKEWKKRAFIGEEGRKDTDLLQLEGH